MRFFDSRRVSRSMRGFRRSGHRNGSKTTASNLRVAQPRLRLPAFDSVPLPFALDACQSIATTSAKLFYAPPSCTRGTYWCFLALVVAVLAQLTSGGGISAASRPCRLVYVNTTFDSTLGFPGKSLYFCCKHSLTFPRYTRQERRDARGE